MKKIGIILSCVFLFASCQNSPGHLPKDIENSVKEAVSFVKEEYHLNVNELTEIDPIYLYIYANHLYKAGKNDEALFWFYVAKYRAIIVGDIENENSCIPSKQERELSAAAGVLSVGETITIGNSGIMRHCVSRKNLYKYVHTGLGEVINYYAGGDIDNWIRQIQYVVAFEKQYPFDPAKAIPAEELNLDSLKDALADAKGLAMFASWLKKHKRELKKQRQENDKWQ